jgi:tripartite ATP-independent transporter DctM subunit
VGEIQVDGGRRKARVIEAVLGPQEAHFDDFKGMNLRVADRARRHGAPPPIGINLFVIQSIWDGKLSEVVYGTIPFHLIMFVVLAMVIFWPELALWLPQQMSGK